MRQVARTLRSGGKIQIGLGFARAGFLSAFFPSSVIKGFLAAIGVILILKQIPHLFGHDADPEGNLSFAQPDHENTMSEFVAMLGDLHPGETLIPRCAAAWNMDARLPGQSSSSSSVTRNVARWPPR